MANLRHRVQQDCRNRVSSRELLSPSAVSLGILSVRALRYRGFRRSAAATKGIMDYARQREIKLPRMRWKSCLLESVSMVRPPSNRHVPDNHNSEVALTLSQRHQAFLRQRPQQSAFSGLQQPAHPLQDLSHAGAVAAACRGAPDRRSCPLRHLRNRSSPKPTRRRIWKPSPNCSTSRPASPGTENIPAAKSTFAPPPAPERSTRSSSIWFAAISPTSKPASITSPPPSSACASCAPETIAAC